MLKVQIYSKTKAEIDKFLNLFEDRKMIGLDYWTYEDDHILDFKLNAPFHLKEEKVTNQKNVTDKKELGAMEQELKEEIQRLNNIIEDLKKPKQDKSKNAQLIALVGLYKNSGLSYQKTADKLNNEGYTNSRNNPLNKMQVKRLYDLYLKEQTVLLAK